MSINGSSASSPRRTRKGAENFDVIVVGGRCAGSPLATLLARAGLRTAVVEQVTFPRTTLSGHLMEADGLQFLKRLGVLDRVEKTGVRFMKRTDLRLNDFRVDAPFPLRFDDLGGAAFLRRHILDEILAETAVEAGADVRMDTKVVELLWEQRRVRGVRVLHKGKETNLYAPLVVGADGRGSSVAYMAGSRKYNVTHNQRSYYFTFFEGADPAADDHFLFHRWGDRMVWGGPADDGLYLLGVSPEEHEREYFRRNTERGLMAHLESCEPAAKALAGAHIAAPIAGIVKFEGYFRQPTGPGWALLGDAGHFKDPSAGRGIGDAFLQVEALAPAIIAGLGGGSGLGPDETLRRWGTWRDRRFEGHYWLATTLGEAGPLPEMVAEAARGLQVRGEIDQFLDLFAHRSKYYDVFPMRDMGAAAARLMLTRSPRRRAHLKETLKLMAGEPGRRWHNRRPAMAPTDLTPSPVARPQGAAGSTPGRIGKAKAPAAADPVAGAAAAAAAPEAGPAPDGSR